MRSASVLDLAVVADAGGVPRHAAAGAVATARMRSCDRVPPPRIPRAQLLLVGLLGLLSLWSLIGDLLELCSACGEFGPAHAAIAGVGAVAYALLALLGCRGRRTWFAAGVVVAAAVHSALAGWLVATARWCPPCLAAGVACLVLATLTLRSRGLGLRRAAAVYCATLAVTAAVVIAMADVQERRTEARIARLRRASAAQDSIPTRIVDAPSRRAAASVASPRASAASPDSDGAALAITVYVREGCHWCDDFRQGHLARLRAEVGSAIAVTVRPAALAPEIRVTPTTIIDHGPVFEGVRGYDELRAAVATAIGRARAEQPATALRAPVLATNAGAQDASGSADHAALGYAGAGRGNGSSSLEPLRGHHGPRAVDVGDPMAGRSIGNTYTVKAGGGGDYTTIQACATALSAGDTCIVYAGTYDEHVTLSAGGAGAYKTLRVNATDLVHVLDFTVGSYDRIIGFHIQNPASPHSHDCIGIIDGSTEVYITGNDLYACGVHAMISGVNAADTNSYVYIQGNTLSYGCSTSSAPDVCGAMHILGDHHLIEGNDIAHVSDGLVNFAGRYNVIRDNRFHDASTADCGANSSNCHIDFLETEPGPGSPPSQYNVIEGNTELNNLGSDGHGYLSQGDACNGQCHNLIIRHNTGAHVGSGGILDDNAGSRSVPGFSYVKSYNNTWVDYNNSAGNRLYGGTNGFTNNSTHGAEINDLFYYPESLAAFNPYATDSTTSGTFSVGHNLAYCTGSPCTLYGHVYGAGSFTDDPGNLVADPEFVDYAGNDFRLASGSPAIGAGTWLTTVAAGDAGSGTTLAVDDAGFFQDGYGLAGVLADDLAVGTTGNHVRITAVDYQANTLTLASAISRAAGDPVWLRADSAGNQVLFGSAADIGAYAWSGGSSSGGTTTGGTATAGTTGAATTAGATTAGTATGGATTGGSSSDGRSHRCGAGSAAALAAAAAAMIALRRRPA